MFIPEQWGRPKLFVYTAQNGDLKIDAYMYNATLASNTFEKCKT